MSILSFSPAMIGLRKPYEGVEANYSGAWFRAHAHWKALIFLGNRSVTIRLKIAAPYEEGLKFGVIEVEVPLWEYALYKVCSSPERLGLRSLQRYCPA